MYVFSALRRALPFAAAGVLFVLYPALRPWADQAPAGMAEAFAAPGWPLAHLSAVAGFVMVGFGLLAVRDRFPGRAARAALGLWAVGAAMTIAYYGAETFALSALSGQADLPALADAVRMGPVQVAVFGVGLIALAAAAVVLVAVLRAPAVPFALGMVLFLPQFFAAPPVRVAHGVLLGAGCLLLAAQAWASATSVGSAGGGATWAASARSR